MRAEVMKLSAIECIQVVVRCLPYVAPCVLSQARMLEHLPLIPLVTGLYLPRNVAPWDLAPGTLAQDLLQKGRWLD